MGLSEKPIETKLYYCQYRYYNPEIYQWLSPDSIEYLDDEFLEWLNKGDKNNSVYRCLDNEVSTT